MKHLLFLFLLLPLLGCGNGNNSMSGTVTFSDDGSPLGTGMVFFETGTYSARGALKADGSYTIGSEKETDGLPAGTYRVYISGAEKQVGEDKSGMPKMEPLINPKFCNGATSGLSVTVDTKTKRFDFQVDKPKR